MLKRGIWIVLIILFSFDIYGQMKEAENFIIATDDKGPVSDVILVSDIISALRFKGYSFYQNSSKLFSEINALRLDNSTLVAISNGDARVVVGIYASPKLADDISEILKDKKISFEVFLSNEIKTSNLKDLFEETVSEFKGDFDNNGCVEFNDFTQFSKAFGECNNQNVTVVSNLEKLVIDNIKFEVNILDSITGFNNTIGFFSDKDAIIVRIGERKNLTENSYVKLEKIEDKKAFIVISFCDKKFDLSGSNEIDIEDFLIFADNFGKCEEIKEQPDVDILNLKNGQILTSGEFKLDIKTKDESVCEYGLFKEVAAKPISNLGIPFETSDGFLHSAKFENLKDGKYVLLIKCDANGVVKESSLNFKVELKGINAEISIATVRDHYWDDQIIELTDPPQDNSFESISGKIVAESSDLLTNENLIVIDENEFVEPNGYIIEFDDDPILVKIVELEKEADENQKYIETHNPLNPNVLTKKAFGVFPDDINNIMESYVEDLNDKNFEIRRRILNELGEENFVAKKPTAPTTNGVKALYEYKNVFNGIALDINSKQAEELKNVPGVKKVYPNYPVQTLLQQSISMVNADVVWGIKDKNNEFLTGKGIDIAVIDTGVDYTHPDLGGCSEEQFLNGNCKKVAGGYDLVDDDKNPMDCNGHGTHVAATAAGNGVLKGVAPDANVYAYRVLDCYGFGDSATIAAAVEKAVDPNGDGNYSDKIDIISMSLGCVLFGCSDDPDEIKIQSVNNAVNAGVIAVIAAGNSGSRTGTIGSPGAAKNAITVGAIDKEWNIAGFSSRGPTLDLDKKTLIDKPDVVAPGVDICAAAASAGTEVSLDNCNNDKIHWAISGTSMATPHVAGAVAILLQKNLDWDPFEIKEALKSTAKDLGLDINTQGAGVVDILKAISLEKPPAIIKIDPIRLDKQNVIVTGIITNDNFGKYEIYLNDGNNESVKIYENTNQVEDDIIVTYDHTSLSPGGHNLELRVYDKENLLIGNKLISFKIPEIMILEIVNETAVDEDGDGLYDSIKINIFAESRVDGEYRISGELSAVGSDNSIYNREINPTISFIKGENIFSFEFRNGFILFENIKKYLLDEGYSDDVEFKAKLLVYKDGLFNELVAANEIPLKNTYRYDNFKGFVDIGAYSIYGFDNRIFANSDNSMTGMVKNYGTESINAKVSIFEIDENNQSLVFEESLTDDVYRSYTEFDFEYNPGSDGLKILRMKVEADGDLFTMNDFWDTPFRVYSNGPDVDPWLDYLPDLVFGETSEISVFVENIGNVDAKDVKISLTATDLRSEETIPIGGKTIKEIKANEEEEIIFDWVPNIKGRIALNVNLRTEGDTDFGNNNDAVFIDIVSNAPDLSTYIRADSEIPIDMENRIDVLLQNRGLKNAENATHSFTILKDEKLIYGENDSFISIESDKEIIIPFTWAPNELGEYLLKSEIYIDSDENPENNIHSRFINVLSNSADVSGFYIFNADKFIVGQTYDLEFYIRNTGFSEAENISILLFKKDELIDGKIIDKLGSREKNKTTLRWAPKKEDIGWNNLKLVVDADNDANPENNENDFSLKVLSDQADVSVHISSREDFVVNKENDLIVQLENEGGKDAEDVDLFLYLKNKITGEEELLVNKKFGSVDAGSFTEWYFSYIPEEIGIERFKAVISHEDDENLGNNQIERDIKIVPQSRLRNLGNDDLFGHLLIEIQRKEGNEWKSHTVLIDDLKNAGRSRTIGSNSVLALDELVNREFGEIRIKDEGEFRIYVAFLDVNGDIIKTMDDKKLEARYQFNKRNYRSEPIPEIPVGGGGSL